MKRCRAYASWSAMKQRCYNPRNKKQYANYGGRGIAVCERWRHSFSAFLADMGERPKGLSLDRVDNNGDYCPENCRWATGKEQHNNKRLNHLITYQDKTQSVTLWADEMQVDVELLRSRVRHGWPVDENLFQPAQARGTWQKSKLAPDISNRY